MRWGFILVLIALLLVHCIEAQTPINGTWVDETCNNVPFNNNLYQMRRIDLGEEITDTARPYSPPSGTWKKTTNYYLNDRKCVDADFTITYVGTYVTSPLTAKPAAPNTNSIGNLQGFYDVDYRITSVTFTSYYDQVETFVKKLDDCTLVNNNFIIPFVTYDVTHSYCPSLFILPIEKCTVIRDIYRRDGPRMWIGNQFPGDPEYWNPACIPSNRPSIFDPYSLSFYETGDFLRQNYRGNVGGLEFYTYSQYLRDVEGITSKTSLTSQYFNLGEHLQSTLVLNGVYSSSANTISISLSALITICLLLL